MGKAKARGSVGGAVAAADVGGTFTDVVLAHRGRLHTAKVPTTRGAAERGVLAGLQEVLGRGDLAARDLEALVHGTTAATNALLQRRGARVALLTNAGFEDALEIGRQARPRLYDLRAVRAEPLVGRDLRFGVAGRLDKDGGEREPLDEASVLRAAGAMRRRGVEACAVGFLHSYANGAHEDRAAALLAQAGVPRVCASHEVDPGFREAERFGTAVANAFLLPVMEGYLERLEAALQAQGFRGPLLVMESSGGSIRGQEAARLPVRTVLSGPAGGAAACEQLAKRARPGAPLLGFDMGGTSTDICPVAGGHAALRHEAEVGGLALRVPTLDIVTIGAGGGSIAHVDPGGLLRVGPDSAEADPGPACYGKGGSMATVTDADLVLGRLAPEHFLGGGMPLAPPAAERALAVLGKALGLDAAGAAAAVTGLAAVEMAHGVRRVTTERGLDPRDFTLVPFGGAGPMHAAGVAAQLGMRRMLLPAQPSVLSAAGMLAADVRHHASATMLRTGPAARPAEVVACLRGLEREVRERMAEEGFRGAAVRVQRSLELRYDGQSHELRVPLRAATQAGVRAAMAGFHDRHHAAYAHRHPGRAVQLVAVRVQASARRRAPPGQRPAKGPGGKPAGEADLGTRRVHFVSHISHGRVEAQVWRRAALRAGDRLRGPCILEGGDHTALLPPGARGRVDPQGNVDVRL